MSDVRIGHRNGFGFTADDIYLALHGIYNTIIDIHPARNPTSSGTCRDRNRAARRILQVVARIGMLGQHRLQ